MSQFELVSYHGHNLITMMDKGRTWVALKPIVEALGLDMDSQRKRVRRNEILDTSTVVMTVQVPGDSQSREWLFLDLDYLNGWLFGIDANRVKPELRDSILDYQRQCYKVLARHFRDKDRQALAHESNRRIKTERAYFRRYPRDEEIRRRVLLAEPYWYIARKVPCHQSTVGNAVRRMLDWGAIDQDTFKSHRIGSRAFSRSMRKSMAGGQQLLEF